MPTLELPVVDAVDPLDVLMADEPAPLADEAKADPVTAEPPIVDVPQAPGTTPCQNDPVPVDEYFSRECSAEEHFRWKMRQASDAVASAALSRLHAENAHKLAKKEFELAVMKLNEIANRGPEHLPLFDDAESSQPENLSDFGSSGREVNDAAEHAGDGRGRICSPHQPAADSSAPHHASDSTTDPNAWRAAYLEVLNLPPALADRLAEAGIATVGQLEDKRAEGDMPGAGLRSIKGIGKAKVTLIEDAVLAWLSANRDAAVLREASFKEAFHEMIAEGREIPANGQLLAEHEQQSPQAPATDDPARESDPIKAAHALANAGEDITADEDLPSISDGTSQSELRKRAAEIMTLRAPDGVADFLRASLDLGAFQSGRDHFNAGDDLTDCPYTPGDAQDSWLKGWLYQNGMGKGATDMKDDEAKVATKPKRKPRAKKPAAIESEATNVN